MTISELIKEKDYDRINIYVTAPKSFTSTSKIFFGVCRSEGGKLISMDGDTYDDFNEVIEYDEFTNENVKNGLYILCPMKWECDLNEK